MIGKIIKKGSDIVAQVQQVLQPDQARATAARTERSSIRIKDRRTSVADSQAAIQVDKNGRPGFIVRDVRRGNTEAASSVGVVNRRRIRLNLDPGWHDHGWALNGDRYTGEYTAHQRRWQGYAVSPAKRNQVGDYDFYILNPPGSVKNHPCWHSAGRGWYWVNFHTPPRDLLSGIKFIEDFLTQVT